MPAPSIIRYSADELARIHDNTYYVPTLLLTHELYKPKDPPKWDDLLGKKVTGCWLAARERTLDDAFEKYLDKVNDWVIVLETPDRRTVTIELKMSDANGNTITICRPAPPIHIVEVEPPAEFDCLNGYAASLKLNVKAQAKVQDWLDYLVKTGVTRYKLNMVPVIDVNDPDPDTRYHTERGRRHWVISVLRQLQGHLLDTVPTVKEANITRCWELWREVDIPPAYRKVKAGRFLPIKWPKPKLQDIQS
ncbi:hypothetical protein F4779DRAFT_643390 [Xylariaceae sp. FL0662B]|nr:hypothetical protein F4779DRAFT_643390 [Xylariaceae sp. FL0662B]